MKNNGVVSKKVFVEIIENLTAVDDYHKGLNNFFEKSGVQGFLYSPDATVSVCQLLKAMFNDPDDVIGTFCFSMDYGRSYKAGYLKDESGKEIDFSTAEKLYDYLVSNS